MCRCCMLFVVCCFVGCPSSFSICHLLFAVGCLFVFHLFLSPAVCLRLSVGLLCIVHGLMSRLVRCLLPVVCCL